MRGASVATRSSMQKLIVSVAIAVAVGSAIGCAGDTSDEDEDQIQQAAVGVPRGTNRGGVASPGVVNGGTPYGPQGTPHRPPETQTQFDDPTQQVEGR